MVRDASQEVDLGVCCRLVVRLFDRDAAETFLSLAKRRDVGLAIGGVINSGILSLRGDLNLLRVEGSVPAVNAGRLGLAYAPLPPAVVVVVSGLARAPLHPDEDLAHVRSWDLARGIGKPLSARGLAGLVQICRNKEAPPAACEQGGSVQAIQLVRAKRKKAKFRRPCFSSVRDGD
ncbi:hypothetical protein [Kaistia adipata]|uniref:hypothetical protein n=1 Tax=Kaistia adipata TaxID=166954 RepID=UPI00048F993D|nr:hypothetical protein [Kaistia adipata]